MIVPMIAEVTRIVVPVPGQEPGEQHQAGARDGHAVQHEGESDRDNPEPEAAAAPGQPTAPVSRAYPHTLQNCQAR